MYVCVLCVKLSHTTLGLGDNRRGGDAVIVVHQSKKIVEVIKEVPKEIIKEVLVETVKEVAVEVVKEVRCAPAA